MATTRDKLVKEYDVVRARRDGVVAELRLDVDGSDRRERRAQIAAAVRAGDPAPDLYLHRAAKELEVDGYTDALEAIRQELIAEIGKDRAHPIRHQFTAEGSGEEVATAVEKAYGAAEISYQASQARLSASRAYDAASEKRHQQKFAHEVAGYPAETFQPDLTDEEWSALNPPGNLGNLQLTGRALDATTIGGRA